jgi:hypothetical protein
MNRDKIIGDLVTRKMQSKDKGKRPICICMAGTTKALSAAGKQPAAANAKC